MGCRDSWRRSSLPQEIVVCDADSSRGESRRTLPSIPFGTPWELLAASGRLGEERGDDHELEEISLLEPCLGAAVWRPRPYGPGSSLACPLGRPPLGGASGAAPATPRHALASATFERMTAAPTTFTEAEYLALERASDRKHEFIAGAIVAMAGARPAHNALASNLAAALVLLTRGRGCLTLSSDQRVHVPATKLYTYPDVTLACGPRRYDDADPPSLLNPTLIVEVTSDTTEDFDRGTKFLHYQSIAELRDYLIVSHREPRIDHFRREGDDQWRLTTHVRDDAVVDLPEHGGGVTLVDVYAGIDLDEGRRTDG